MFETFIGNKKKRLFYFLGLVLTFGFVHAQAPSTIPDVEKVYLHTDRSIYFVGEDLWYKAYNVNAYNNLLYDNSNVLYVELISADAKIVARNKTNLEVGLGHGDFQLKDSLDVKPGIYQLRAYTNWNRNFGDDFVFKKNIEIIDVFESNSNDNKESKIKDPTIKIETVKSNNKKSFKVDFFPEGGSLLENVASVVGFKAVDNNGKPIEINGEIYDSDNELVTVFESVHDGMGKFQMLPMEGKNYFAKLKSPSGEELKIELPNVLKQGYLLSFRAIKGRNIVSISTNQATLAQNPNPSLTVVCKAKGIQYLETTQTLTETSLSFELPKDKFPEGISQITLFDNSNKPQSERLIYIEKVKDLEVQLTTDKASYGPNEKVIVNVSSKSKTGEGKSASFSVSVTDRNGLVEEKNFDSNICSYFLIESDIRGKIYNPGYYFDTKNPNRLKHLDNLLLTQGWRDFVWKTMPKANDTINYIVEKGINVSGKVKQLFGNKAKENYEIGLVLLNSKYINTFKTTTDSIGKFKFENLKFSEKMKMTLSSKDERGKFRGEIVLDSVGEAPMVISFKKEPIIWSESTNLVVENVFRKYTTFGVKPENILKEVKIIAKNKHQTAILYGIPNYVYVPDKDAHKFNNIRDFINEKMPQTNFIAMPGEVEMNEPVESGPIVLINGYPITEEGELSFVNPSDVLKIDAIIGNRTLMFIYGEQAKYGIISIHTNGKIKKNPIERLHSITREIEGYYLGRTFYAPTPEQAELDVNAAVRNTIYWNPEVCPDKAGTASVSYHNTKVETKVKVALEGITGSGIPVVKNVYYTIKN